MEVSFYQIAMNFLFTPKGIPSSWKLLMIIERIILPKDSEVRFVYSKSKRGDRIVLLEKNMVSILEHTFITGMNDEKNINTI